MRVPMSKVWRAFAELDRFDDERCARFVRAAKRRWWVVAMVQGTAASLAWLVMAVPAMGLAMWASESLTRRLTLGDAGFVCVLAVVASLSLGITFVPLLLFKDWRLRRRIRVLIAARGSCVKCGYGLLGLPVSEGLRVRCPECGCETVVDRALGELVSDERGRAMYQAAEDVGELPTWFTPVWRRWISRGIVTVVLLAALGVGGWWGWQTLMVRMDAAAARADRAESVANVAALVELAARGQPELGPGERDGWVILEALGDAEKQASVRAIDLVIPGLKEPDVFVPWSDGRREIEYEELSRVEPQEAGQRQYWRANREAARVLVEMIGSTEVLGLMRELIGFRRAVGGLDLPAGKPVFLGNYDSLSEAGRLARFMGGLMDLALERGDRAAWLESFEACLALGRLIRLHPTPIRQFDARRIGALAGERTWAALDRGVDAEWLAGIAGAMDRQQRPSSGQWLEAARLEMLDTVAWVFEDVEKNVGAEGVDLWMPGWRLGRYQENREAVEVFSRELAMYAGLSSVERAKVAEPLANRVTLASMWSHLPRAVMSMDRAEGDRDLLRVTIAVEWFRLAKGRLPATLGELVPEYLAELPVDVTKGLKLKIRAVDPKFEMLGRGYVIELEPAAGGAAAKPGG